MRIGKKYLKITCDNCAGQNKNNLSLWFWAWLVMLGWYKDIIVNFMIPDYTKFVCDAFFRHIKKVYRDTRINTINDIERVVNCSSKGNEAVCYRNAQIWYNFEGFFKNYFISLSNIKKYHHFHFSSDKIGKVYVSKESEGEETSFLLLRNNSFNKNGQIGIIPISSLTKARK